MKWLNGLKKSILISLLLFTNDTNWYTMACQCSLVGMIMALSNYINICDSLVSLMAPLIEIVMHDIASDSIVYIKGPLSKRKIGDPSLLRKGDFDDINKIVYATINVDGRLIKSISVLLEDKWLLCINCDISIFSNMKDLCQRFLINDVSEKPQSLFVNDWQDKLHMSIHSYLQAQHLSFENLRHADKKALVKHLFELGAFQEKKAADYVAKTLNLGRATVFKYLKEMRSSCVSIHSN